MKLEHSTKSGHMMMAMNKWSVAYLSVALVACGEGVEFISFIQRHPSVVWQLATFSVASALGQVRHQTFFPNSESLESKLNVFFSSSSSCV